MNKCGKLWEIAEPSELRKSYPYAIYHLEGNTYQFVNRNYSDLDSDLAPHNGGRTGIYKFKLSQEQIELLTAICDKVGESYFLYDDRTYPWANENAFDKYFNKYYEVKKVMGLP